jgi:uncharacterized protein YlxW (UPF0749 family)
VTGYIVLAVFVFLVISHTAVFFAGYSRARKAAEAERAEEARRRLQSDRDFQKQKEDVLKEVQTNAEDKKANISTASGRAGFDAINDSLRNNSKN